MTVALAIPVAAIPTPAAAELAPPWDGNPITAGLGPTYGEPWCAPVGSENVPQTAPLAVIPYGAIGCTLDQILAEGAAAGIPTRMSYSVIGQSVLGRDIYGVVVNALETPEQVRDYERWQQLRSIMLTDPAEAQALLASWGDEVKLPIFIEANIHGGEREGTDAMMQVFRDLVTTPYGVNEIVDAILDHAIVIAIPTTNPDGRVAGTRANANGFDMNRDLLVQSQPEMQANTAFQLEWLAPVMLAMHGYVNPTLIDGLTKPHNPGLEYDLFAYWNQRRLDANEVDFAAIQQSLTRPVNDYGPNGGQQATITGTGATQSGTTVTITTTGAHGLAVGQTVRIAGVGVWGYNGTFVVTSVPTPTTFTYETTAGLGPSGSGVVFTGDPAVAEGWDDWGPFYTQTYGAFFGVDGSTLEMCSNAVCGGRFGSKRAQYLGFYSSADFWIENRSALLHDQLEIFRRARTDALRPNCCDDPLLAQRGFTEDQHDWMVEYPRAYVIPFDDGAAGTSPTINAQRSDAEANRLVQWLLDNGIEVHRTNKAYSWNGKTFAKKSYVVWMNQPLRGLALTALSAGQDISDRITQLYAPPGAWSHGLLWGADVVEVPRGDASFAPFTVPVSVPNELNGGVRGGGRSDWYAATLRGTAEVRAVLDLLRSGVDGEVAEAPFTSTTGGQMPAGSVIFPNDPATVAALDAAGKAAGFFFERNRGAKPSTTQLDEAPRVAVLVNTATPAVNDQFWSLQQIFGPDLGFVSTVTGPGSLQNAAADPLAGYDVIYNTGQGYPGVANATARARLDAFFAGGGGYLGTGVSATNFTFLTGAGLVGPSFTLGSAAAGGGIARWNNAGTSGPLTGGYPSQDFLYLPTNVTYFSAIPTGAVVDGRYPATASELFVAGLWRSRTSAASLASLNAPVVVHGNTLVGSRYLGFGTNPFSRGDAEREWPLIGQAALWSNLTDEGP